MQQLRHERGRALLEESGLTMLDVRHPAALWADVEAAFAEHDRRQAVTSAAGTERDTLTQVANAARSLHDILTAASRPQCQGAWDALEARLGGGGGSTAAALTVLRQPEILLALVAAARSAAHDKQNAEASEDTPSRQPEKARNGWILAAGLPGVFSRHTGQEAVLVPLDADQPAPTACMRFIQAAFELSGRELLDSPEVISAVRHWNAAQAAERQAAGVAEEQPLPWNDKGERKRLSGQPAQGHGATWRSLMTRRRNKG